jgi:hypothetical protein
MIVVEEKQRKLSSCNPLAVRRIKERPTALAPVCGKSYLDDGDVTLELLPKDSIYMRPRSTPDWGL